MATNTLRTQNTDDDSALKVPHKLLLRYMTRIGLSYNLLPTDIKKWHEFITKINNSFNDNDQERYLLERSMKISSEEIMALNERLVHAHHIAGMGYWQYDCNHQKFNWSSECDHIFGIDSLQQYSNIDDITNLFDTKNKKKFNAFIKSIVTDNRRHACELQIKYNDTKTKWLEIIEENQNLNKKNIEQIQGIIIDITARKNDELKIDRARNIGMAEIASSILHNIGNVLNSANVSINLLNEIIDKLYITDFITACNMLEKNMENLANYITNDEKGKIIPQYLIALSKTMHQQYDLMCSEATNITNHLKHITAIIVAQQSIAKTENIESNILLSDVVDSALLLSGINFSELSIKIHKNYREPITMTTDKSKLTQIIINLIKNAKEAIALVDNTKIKPEIMISIEKSNNPKKALIIVQDNGIGIDKTELQNIFTFGYTTKLTGHGFGLHSSMLAAQELRGKLSVTSDGINKGATFILEI